MEASIKKKKEVDLTNGNLFKKIIIVALPLMFSGILQLLYNAADLIVCGTFGTDHAVGAISATNSLINLIVQLFLGFSVGANVLMARTYGAKDREKCSRVAHSAIVLSLIVGVVIGTLGCVFSRFFLELMDTPDEVIDLSHTYLFIYFLGLPFSMLYNFGASLLRAVGDTKRPFYFLAFAGLINVLLNLFLVIVCGLDVAGVAIGTVASQFVSSILVLICLLKTSGYCKIEIKKLKLHKEEVKEIVIIGLPAGLEGVIFSLSNVIIQSSVNSLGTAVMDGNGASGSLEGFIFTCMNSIAQTNIAFVSANFGAKKIENIKKSVIYSSILIVITSFIVGTIMFIFGKPLLSLYINGEAEHIEYAIEQGFSKLSLFCFMYFLCGLMNCFAASLRGMGSNLLPTIITLIGACGIRVFWVFIIFPLDTFHSLRGLAISYPVSWLITLIVLIICYFIKRRSVFNKINNEINFEILD